MNFQHFIVEPVMMWFCFISGIAMMLVCLNGLVVQTTTKQALLITTVFVMGMLFVAFSYLIEVNHATYALDTGYGFENLSKGGAFTSCILEFKYPSYYVQSTLDNCIGVMFNK